MPADGQEVGRAERCHDSLLSLRLPVPTLAGRAGTKEHLAAGPHLCELRPSPVLTSRAGPDEA